MSQEFLDHSQVGAAVKKMGREAVTQRMRRGLLVEPGDLDVLVENLPNASAGEPLAEAIEEESVRIVLVRRVGLFPGVDIPLDRLEGETSNRYDSLLGALAARLDHLSAEVEGGHVESRQLADPQACRVEGLEDRPVAGRLEGVALGSAQELLYLVDAEGEGELLLDLRSLDRGQRIGRDVPFAHQELVEAAYGRQLSNDRRGLVVALFQLGQEFTHLHGGDAGGMRNLRRLLAEETHELVEILFVGADRLRRHVSLVAEVLHEFLFVINIGSARGGAAGLGRLRSGKGVCLGGEIVVTGGSGRRHHGGLHRWRRRRGWHIHRHGASLSLGLFRHWVRLRLSRLIGVSVVFHFLCSFSRSLVTDKSSFSCDSSRPGSNRPESLWNHPFHDFVCLPARQSRAPFPRLLHERAEDLERILVVGEKAVLLPLFDYEGRFVDALRHFPEQFLPGYSVPETRPENSPGATKRPPESP